MHDVGFTGTREADDITPVQREWLVNWLTVLWASGARRFHHGDCVGADALAHDVARDLGYWIVGHPPTDERYRAFKKCDELREAEPFLHRNRRIVDESNIMLGVPGGYEQLRSGTWSTIRYTERQGKYALGIHPDGSQFQRPKDDHDDGTS
jgi:hypothetical protein